MESKFRTDVLLSAMRTNGISQAALAKLVGTNRSSVKRWCDGKNVPRYEIATKICDALGVEVNDLFGEEQKPVVVNRELDYLQIMYAIQKNVEKFSRDQRMFLISLLVK